MIITKIWQRRHNFILVTNQKMDIEHSINEEIHSTVVILS